LQSKYDEDSEMSKHTFETERLLIRPISQQDQALYCSLYSNDKTMKFIGLPLTVAKASRAFNSIIKKQKLNNLYQTLWVIVFKACQSKVGIVATSQTNLSINKQLDETEIGILLLNQYTGLKIGTEALKSLMRYLKHKTLVTKLHAFHHLKNIASDKAFRRLGFANLIDSTNIDNKSVHKIFIYNTELNKNKINSLKPSQVSD